MTSRLTSAALLALTVAAVSAPVHAQEAGTFAAWGHNFLVPGHPVPVMIPAAPRTYDTLEARRVAAPHVYTSSGRENVSRAASQLPAAHSLNVWGTRIEAPVR